LVTAMRPDLLQIDFVAAIGLVDATTCRIRFVPVFRL
jgi:hypothetical protein